MDDKSILPFAIFIVIVEIFLANSGASAIMVAIAYIFTWVIIVFICLKFNIYKLQEKYLAIIMGIIAIIAGMVLVGKSVKFDIDNMQGKYKQISAVFLGYEREKLDFEDAGISVYRKRYEYNENGIIEFFKGKRKFLVFNARKRYEKKEFLYRDKKTGKLRESPPKEDVFYGIIFICAGVVILFWKYRKNMKMGNYFT